MRTRTFVNRCATVILVLVMPAMPVVLPATRSLARADPAFVRGDSNADGTVDLADAVFTLLWSFRGGAEPGCMDAADTDDNGRIEVADAIRILLYLFAGGTAPESPFPGCGTDPSADALDCGAFAPCTVNLPPTATFAVSARTGVVPLTVELDASGSGDPDGAIVAYLWDFGDGATAEGPLSTHTYDRTGRFTVTLTVRDDLGLSSSSSVSIDVREVAIPPDPVDVAPPLDGTSIPSFTEAVAFLYTADDAIQTGVAPDAIVPLRAAVLRGRVTTREGDPLSGVSVDVLHHPELGSTVTRPDGMFDLAVNGGGAVVVRYERQGFLPAQRQVDVPWQDYRTLPDVALIPLDPQVTAIDLTASVPVQVARASVMTDADGTRQATVLVPQGTTATMQLPGGDSQPLSTLSIRATEYTVGASGPRAMPAELPPTSAYTYAMDLSVDEALASGATEVRFSSSIPFYVENFLGFPVGTAVPLGGYDRVRGVWVPADSGRVVEILGVTGGLADMDVDGDGIGDGGAALAALAITDAERQQLALLYPPGQSLWRVLIPHFSPWDCNWAIEPPSDAVAPEEDPEVDEHLEGACTVPGSIIECQNQTLGEVVEVPGTPLRLHYQSDRAPGHRVPYTVEIPLSGEQLPASLQQIELEIQVAGRVHRQRFVPALDQRTTFAWDGKDVYGRTVQGRQRITVSVGYTYDAVYTNTGRFGYNGDGTPITGNRARQEVTLWRVWSGLVGSWDVLGNGLGGWTLSAHHGYDPVEQVLYRGDGGRQGAQAVGSTIRTFAGRAGLACSTGASGNGGPATEARLCPAGVAAGPDGSLYIVEFGPSRVRRVDTDGIITTVAGTGQTCRSGPCGEGGPATLAPLGQPREIAIGPDGSLYIDEVRDGNPLTGATRIVRRISPDGIITTFAGNGIRGFSGDGGPATLAQFSLSLRIAVAPDGSVYIADVDNGRIRRVGTDGIIDTVVAGLTTVTGIAGGGEGSLYFTQHQNRVCRVTADGILSTIAGTGQNCQPTTAACGDGGPADQATLTLPAGIAVDRYDNVYVYTSGGRIRWLRPGGTIATLAGTGSSVGSFEEGAPARSVPLDSSVISGSVLAVGPDGSVYIAQIGIGTVRRIAPSAAAFVPGGLAVPSPDGSEVYLLDLGGRHLQTLDALTAALRHEFAYDAAGRLAEIADGDGNVTTIERDAAGTPTAIVAPFGQRTTLAVKATGFLERIVHPTGDTMRIAYTADGLLTGMTDPRGHTSQYAFDPLGRLVSATDPTGATTTLVRTGTNEDFAVTLTSALGRETAYRVERLPSGTVRLTTTDCTGAASEASIGADGRTTASDPGGLARTVVLGPDPRWGMRSPLAASLTTATPGGLTMTTASESTAELPSPGDLLDPVALTTTVTINGRAWTTAYDGPTRTLESISPAGRTASVAFDDRGRPVEERLGDLHPIAYAYDARGRLATIAQGEGADRRVTAFDYGSDGFLARVTDPLGRETAFAHDAGGRLTEETLPGGLSMRYAYEPGGNVREVTPPGRPAHAFAYTPRDEVAAYAPPAVGAGASETLFAYDADRNPTRIDHPDGGAVRFQYEEATCHLDLVDLGGRQRTYAYDDAGRPIALGSGPGVSLAYAYDGGVLTGATWSGAVSASVTLAYDSDFRVNALRVNGADPVAIAYDADGLEVQVGGLVVTRSPQTGLITATTLGSVADSTSRYGFGDPVGYTASFDGAALYAAVYTRDSLGRIREKTETLEGGTRVLEYVYDAAGRLGEVRQDGVLAAAYAYDPNGNRLSRTDLAGTVDATHDEQDRLLRLGSTTYAHNRRGERTSKVAGGQTTTYRYEGLGSLVGATLPGGAQIEYLLDAEDRRVGKRVDGMLVQAFLYQDGLRPMAELDGSGVLVSRFVYLAGGNVPDSMVRGGATYRIISDHLGSPRLVVDIATGEIVQRMDHDEFGRVTLDTNPGFQPFGFAGGLHDRDTDLVHFGAREYDPETGRWTTKDPIGFAAGDGNLYAYVGNEPVNHVDPSGLCRDTVTCTCVRQPQVCAELGGLASAGAAAARQGADAVRSAGPAAANIGARVLSCPTPPQAIVNGLFGPVQKLNQFIVQAILRVRPELTSGTAEQLAELLVGRYGGRQVRSLIASGGLARLLNAILGRR